MKLRKDEVEELLKMNKKSYFVEEISKDDVLKAYEIMINQNSNSFYFDKIDYDVIIGLSLEVNKSISVMLDSYLTGITNTSSESLANLLGLSVSIMMNHISSENIEAICDLDENLREAKVVLDSVIKRRMK